MDDSQKKGILEYFNALIDHHPDVSAAVAAIKTLLHFIENNHLETLAELRAILKDAINTLMGTDSSVTSISSGCELFLRFITLTSLDYTDFKKCQTIMVQRGNTFLDKVASSRLKIAQQTDKFIRDGSKILIHSHSRVVQQVLKAASQSNKRFEVFVTESRPNDAGVKTKQELDEYGIPSTLVLDSAVGSIMEKVDMVLCGAEGVVESGGIINKIGTFSIAIAAKAMNKPFYVVAESFKFVRLFPLNQRDLPNQFKVVVALSREEESAFKQALTRMYKASTLQSGCDLDKEHPLVDYTPPSYITLLFTDLGVLTPSAVSDELIKLYC